MKFLVVRKYYGPEVVEAEDIKEALESYYNNHTGYDEVWAIAKMEEE